MVKVLDLRNAKYASEDKSLIDVEVNFEHLPEEYVDFTADKNDPMEHGRRIYNALRDGYYGDIAPYQEG